MDKVENELQEIYSKIGFIVHLSQMIEYNLAYILALDNLQTKLEKKELEFVYEYNEIVDESNKWYDKLTRMTLGSILKKAKEIKYFTKSSYKLLKKVLTERNEIIHNFFKKDLKDKILEKTPSYFKDYLSEQISEFCIINNELIRILEDEKLKLSNWK